MKVDKREEGKSKRHEKLPALDRGGNRREVWSIRVRMKEEGSGVRLL